MSLINQARLLLISAALLALSSCHLLRQDPFYQGNLIYSSGSSGVYFFDLKKNKKRSIYKNDDDVSQFYNIQPFGKDEILFVENSVLGTFSVKKCSISNNQCDELFTGGYSPLLSEAKDRIYYLKRTKDKKRAFLYFYEISNAKSTLISELNIYPRERPVLLPGNKLAYLEEGADIKIIDLTENKVTIIPSTRGLEPVFWRSKVDELFCYNKANPSFSLVKLNGEVTSQVDLPGNKGATYIEELDSIIYSKRSWLSFATYVYSFESKKTLLANDSGFSSGYWFKN